MISVNELCIIHNQFTSFDIDNFYVLSMLKTGAKIVYSEDENVYFLVSSSHFEIVSTFLVEELIKLNHLVFVDGFYLWRRH